MFPLNILDHHRTMFLCCTNRPPSSYVVPLLHTGYPILIIPWFELSALFLSLFLCLRIGIIWLTLPFSNIPLIHFMDWNFLLVNLKYKVIYLFIIYKHDITTWVSNLDIKRKYLNTRRNGLKSLKLFKIKVKKFM